MRGVPLHLPRPLEAALWTHARRDAPHECVGALGGHVCGADFVARALYPLPNVAPEPERAYLAGPESFLRAMRAMREGCMTLVGLYHSHPRGPAWPSETDRRLAAYPVPYLIADLRGGTLRAYLLPEGGEVPLSREGAPRDGRTRAGEDADGPRVP